VSLVPSPRLQEVDGRGDRHAALVHHALLRRPDQDQPEHQEPHRVSDPPILAREHAAQCVRANPRYFCPRCSSQIRQALKKKAFEDAGIPAKQVPVQQVQHVLQTLPPQQPQQPQQTLQQTPPQVFKSQPIVQHVQLVAQPKQIILHPQTTTTTGTTVTVKQYQQMQKAAALAAAQAAASAANNTPTITENIIIQQPTSTSATVVQQPHVVSTCSSTQIVVPVVPAVSTVSTVLSPTVVIADDVVSTSNPPATTTSTVGSPAGAPAGLKCGPDVSMTLNRINVQENEVDVEECLPAEVVKLDFVSEEVAG